MANDLQSNTRLSKEHIGQTHVDCFYDGDFSVFLINAQQEKIKIIDSDGRICGFPGIEDCEALRREISVEDISPVVRYSTTFEQYGSGLFRMIWTVRPDGRFWMDSWGFGAEDYESVVLYSCFDETGRFIAPFRLYRIGYRTFAKQDEAL